MKKLTIYTPTYNRANLLPRLYQSLVNQTCQDFLWLVIDDGSTDNTKEVIDSWVKEKIIDIEYVYKTNGGVHTARNLAFNLCKTELISGCDSDDVLTKNAIELWITEWEEKGGPQYSGIISVTNDENGNRVTDVFPPVDCVSYQDYTYKYHCYKEKDAMFNVAIAANLEETPVFENENFVAESYRWLQFPQNKPFILLDEVTRIYEQQADGYMNAVAKNRFKNPNGFRASSRQQMVYGIYPNVIFKGIVGYVAYSIILKDKKYIMNSPKPLATLLLTPLGVIAYLLFLLQRN